MVPDPLKPSGGGGGGGGGLGVILVRVCEPDFRNLSRLAFAFEKNDLFIYLIEQNVYIFIYCSLIFYITSLLSVNKVYKLEDLTVLRCSPDLLNNVKIGQDQLRHIMKHILFYGGCSHFGQVTLNNLMNTPPNSPVISVEKMFR